MITEYARFADAGGQCDVYAYRDRFGWHVEVARTRRPRPISDPDFRSAAAMNQAMRRRAREAADPTNLPRPIGLRHDGAVFHEATHEAFLARLLHLREAGYLVPQFAVDAVTEEMNDAPA